MDKADTPQTMRLLAAKMRQQAHETSLPEYQAMMNRTADTLDAEANLAADRQFLEFSRELETFCDAQFSSARFH